MSRIAKTFDRLKKEGRKAFIPYVMAGDPSLEHTARLVHMLSECGADIIELGVPFSDPLADGPVIQRAAERSLAGGTRLRHVIALVRELRASTQTPIVLMTYYNPIFKYGEERFTKDASEAGVDGLIIPDLPPHEARSLIKLCRPARIDTIFLTAPTSTAERRKIVAKAASGFIYYVSITGITGARLATDGSIAESVRSMGQESGKPVAVGFGVSTPQEASAMAGFADGVIVGSAIVRRNEDPGLREFVLSLRAAIG